MKLLKQLLLQPILKTLIRKNMVTQPKVVSLEEKQCIGYMITTSFKGNQKKKDTFESFHFSFFIVYAMNYIYFDLVLKEFQK